MEDEVIEKYREAGRIAAEARDLAEELVEPGVKLEEVAEKVEGHIRKEGAEPAFPVNLSVNEEAAHYTPLKNDDREFSEGDIVKIDVGAHVDGYIGDTAVTKDLGDHDSLVEAARNAVVNGLEAAGEVGRIAEESMEELGVKPIRNLGGHTLEKYTQHAGTMIPCIETSTSTEMEKGKAYAIECFATDGAGKVVEGKPGNIYKYEGGNVRNRTARKILKAVKSNYRTLPFTTRWLDFSPARIKLAMSRMVSSGVMKDYGILKEKDDGMVAQHEHTLIITDDGVEVTTRIE